MCYSVCKEWKIHCIVPGRVIGPDDHTKYDHLYTQYSIVTVIIDFCLLGIFSALSSMFKVHLMYFH